MCFPLQTLYLRARDGLRRMPLYSVRNNSRSLCDRSAFARVSESVVCDGAAAVLRVRFGFFKEQAMELLESPLQPSGPGDDFPCRR